MHHNQLCGGQDDSVILGASTLAHLDQNLAAAEAAPLPLEVVQAFNSAWKVLLS
jgi:aflatoxin B1 aldehyde reductase